MKILFTCNEFPPYPNGGFGTFIKEISVELTKQNHQVYVYGVYPISKRKVIMIDGVTFIADPKRSSNGYLNRINEIYVFGKEVNKLVKKYNIDIIDTEDSRGWFLFINNNKLFVRLHSSNIYFKKNRGRFNTIIEQIAFRIKRPKIIAVSQFILEQFNRKFNKDDKIKNTKVILNGIKIGEQKDNSLKRKKSIVFAGTIKPAKGIKYLIDAFVKSGIEKEYTLDLYGKDINLQGISYIKQLLSRSEQIKKLVKLKIINYHGVKSKKEIMTKYAEATICVFPSEFESFGLVVIEAMSVGALVIYTNQGAAKEIVSDNKDAFLVPIKNSNALAKKIKFVINMDEVDKEKVRGNAIKKAQKFSIENCVTKSLNYYLKQDD